MSSALSRWDQIVGPDANLPTTTFQDPFSEELWTITYRDHSDQDINSTFKRLAIAAAEVEETDELKKKWALTYYEMLTDFKTTTGGRIYSNAGTEWKGTTLMNCFVSPRASENIDSLKGIGQDLINQAMTLKSEGGWGQNFSFIRPRGAFIKGVGVETPGSVKYMELYDRASDIVTSGSGKKSTNKTAKGKIRKGAMMGVLDVWHPDILEFITAKQSAGRLSKFNVSVNCTDEFMQKLIATQTALAAVAERFGIEPTVDSVASFYVDNLSQLDEADTRFLTDYVEKINSLDSWDLVFPNTAFERYDSEWTGDLRVWKERGYPIDVYKTVSVTGIWDLIMKSTYNRAEPGVLFLDRANYFNPLNYRETIFATNPCGEQVLAPGGVCNLASINLTQFINDELTDFNYDEIAKYTRYLNRFLDSVNSISDAPLPEYVESMRKKRRVGIGILGWGSALYMMKIRFGSDRASELRDKVMETIARSAYMSSIDLAEEKGMFEYCIPEKHAKGAFVLSLDLPEEYMEKLRTTGIRNSSLLSIQPTGNTSILANVVSGGLEPVFMPEYIRTVIMPSVPAEIEEVTPKWYEGEWHETELFKFDKEGDEEILRGVHNGTVYKIDRSRGLTREVLCQDYGTRFLSQRGEWDPEADWAATTANLTAEDHLNDLKGFARWVDSAMSKTVNVPNDYPFEDFSDLYVNAYKSGHIKGVTTYRSGTMTAVLSAKEEEDELEEIIVDDMKVPTQGEAKFSTIRAEGKKWYLTTLMDESGVRPVAFFVHTNAHEKSVTTNNAVDKLLELARKKKIPERWIKDTEEKINTSNNATKIARCISLNLRHGVLIKNVVYALEQVDDVFVGSFLFQIKKYLMTWIKDGEKVTGTVCPNCNAKDSMVYSEGCVKCNQCGSSKC